MKNEGTTFSLLILRSSPLNDKIIQLLNFFLFWLWEEDASSQQCMRKALPTQHIISFWSEHVTKRQTKSHHAMHTPLSLLKTRRTYIWSVVHQMIYCNSFFSLSFSFCIFLIYEIFVQSYINMYIIKRYLIFAMQFVRRRVSFFVSLSRKSDNNTLKWKKNVFV